MGYHITPPTPQQTEPGDDYHAPQAELAGRLYGFAQGLPAHRLAEMWRLLHAFMTLTPRRRQSVVAFVETVNGVDSDADD